ncbi:MAG: hypothetical protein IJP22_02315 [Clostridia bacterium]|nr:hypothetical protein [Clostridia bacterium]
MKACTFFGSSNTSYKIREDLRAKIIELIKEEAVTRFYVGTHGQFDFYTSEILFELKEEFPQIKYFIVLSRIDYTNSIIEKIDFSHILFPEGIEKIPPRFRIVWRNRWMIKNCDFVIYHIEDPFSKAVDFVNEARKKGKTTIKI